VFASAITTGGFFEFRATEAGVTLREKGQEDQFLPEGRAGESE